MQKRYQHIVVGGTFDLLHSGHHRLLNFAIDKASLVTIGLTSDVMVKKFLKKNNQQSYSQRKVALIKFIKSKKQSVKVSIIKIEDSLGVAGTSEDFDAIVVSPETEKGAKKINEVRSKLGLNALEVLVVPIMNDDDGEKLSSERIRNGETDRTGVAYHRLIDGMDFKLPNTLRPTVAKPLGMIIQNEEQLLKLVKKSLLVVAVGDEVTRIINRGAKTDLAIVDFLINRKRQINNMAQLGFDEDLLVVNVNNKAGTISRGLSKTVIRYFENPEARIVIKVNGEEDLGVIPVILCAPLNTLVVYGQRGRGAVVVYVSETLKEKAYKLLLQFTAS